MLHLRIIVPPGRVATTRALLEGHDAVVHVVHLPGVATKPAGDLLLLDVAREAGSALLEELEALGLTEDGAISILDVETSLSAAAQEAEERAAGAPADAVVWEQVVEATGEEATLSYTFLAFMVIAALIAAVGIMTDSPILIIGAMVVGPEFGPLAGISVGLVQRRTDGVVRSLRAIAVGFPLAIAACVAFTVVLDAAGRLPDDLLADDRPLTGFIAKPDLFTFVVALLAGIAGVLSLTSAKAGALIGVLISVTTIPAAADVGVSLGTAAWSEALRSGVQLGGNLVTIVLAGVLTLGVQRWRGSRLGRAGRPPG